MNPILQDTILVRIMKGRFEIEKRGKQRLFLGEVDNRFKLNCGNMLQEMLSRRLVLVTQALNCTFCTRSPTYCAGFIVLDALCNGWAGECSLLVGTCNFDATQSGFRTMEPGRRISLSTGNNALAYYNRSGSILTGKL